MLHLFQNKAAITSVFELGGKVTKPLPGKHAIVAFSHITTNAAGPCVTLNMPRGLTVQRKRG